MPGVLVCHQGMGLSDHAKERARMLAELGYIAFALDMYGEVATSREQVMALIGDLVGNPALLRRRATAGLDVLKAGGADPLIPPAARERFIALMNEAEADWQLLTYSHAGHSFTDRTVDALGMPGFFHHAPTDRRSWAAMRDLFDEAMGRA